ncbi:MAG: hypothetical protein Q4G28_07650 [Neisseria sp.]|nr:hypothetical protein [Neisseria sp.]
MKSLIAFLILLLVSPWVMSAPSLSSYNANGYSWKSANIKAKRSYVEGFIHGVDLQGYQRSYSSSAMLKCLDDAYTTSSKAEMNMGLQEMIQLCHHFMNL